MLFSSDTALGVADLLKQLGFEELAPLPAVPIPNSRRITYPLRVTMRRDDSQWAVRSYGTAFDLVDPGRRALARRRWFSIGWGLEKSRSTGELLLAQADDISAEEVSELTGAVLPVLRACAAPWTHELRTGSSGSSLRLSAVLSAEEETF